MIIKQRPNNGSADIMSRIYSGRGQSVDTDYSLRKLIPYSNLLGIDKLAVALADDIMDNKKIHVMGDYDVDGATASTVAVLGLRALGGKSVNFSIPNRFIDGYGLTVPFVESVYSEHMPDTLVTVDNGISSVDGVAKANELGMSVIVTDHHLAGSTLPDARAIVNPNQPECTFPSKALAGVGTIFYSLLAVKDELLRRDYFNHQGIPVPNLALLLDLVALGTIADLVSLDYNNRVLVSYGMKLIKSGQGRPGITQLIKVSGKCVDEILASDLSFSVAPRLNAAGRLEDMSLGIRCLLENDEDVAYDLALQLNRINEQRRDIENEMKSVALTAVDALTPDVTRNSLVMYDESYHQGVIGIVASRLKEKYYRPTIVFADGGDGTLKGSARSIPGFHLRDALDRVANTNKDTVIKFGGHAMAAGATIYKDKLDVFTKAFNDEVNAQLTEEQLLEVMYTDGELPLDEISLKLAVTINEGGPWGQNFPAPTFNGKFMITNKRVIAGKHLKCTLFAGVKDDKENYRMYDAFAFNVPADVLPKVSVPENVYANVVYALSINTWRDKAELQLMISHLEVL